MQDLLDRLARARSEARVAAQTGEPERALAELLAAAGLVAQLRRAAAPEQALAEAEATLALATQLARADGPHFLPALVAASEQFARCCQRARRYEPAAQAFAQAVEGAKILALGGGAARSLALAELMSTQALCLAQCGRLDEARTAVTRSVELARAQLWRSLPLIVGGLSLAAELAGDLGDEAGAVAHLHEAHELLERALAEQQPGAREALATIRAELEQRRAKV